MHFNAKAEWKTKEKIEDTIMVRDSKRGQSQQITHWRLTVIDNMQVSNKIKQYVYDREVKVVIVGIKSIESVE